MINFSSKRSSLLYLVPAHNQQWPFRGRTFFRSLDEALRNPGCHTYDLTRNVVWDTHQNTSAYPL